MRRRLLTVVVGGCVKFDLDQSGVHGVEERRADMGVIDIQPLSADFPIRQTVVVNPPTSSKRNSDFKAHADKKQKECSFLFSSVFKIVLK